MSMTSLVRTLPRPIRNVLRYLYNIWRLRPVVDNKIVDEVSEYYELSRKEALRLMKPGLKLNADLWRAFHPKSDQEKPWLWVKK